MKNVLIIRTGRAPAPIRARHGDFPDWFRRAARLPPGRVRIIDVESGEKLPPPRDVAGAIITGSGAMVTERLPWSEETAGWIRAAMDDGLPLFGVCYGHQLMAHALGGRIDYLEGGREIGTQPITWLDGAADDVVAAATPNGFAAHTTHEQAVLEVPAGATILAHSARDPHQVLRYGPHAISTQFHPEFSADVMRAYLRYKAAGRTHGAILRDPLYRAVGATPWARRVLRKFAWRHGWQDAA